MKPFCMKPFCEHEFPNPSLDSWNTFPNPFLDSFLEPNTFLEQGL